jgi:uncharacterized protein (DUF1684 family)
VSLALLDWRRRVAEMYAGVRATSDPVAAHTQWRATRDELFRSHPVSALSSAAREVFTGLDVAPYDPEYRWTAAIDRDVEPKHQRVESASDGVITMDRLGVVALDGIGSLDVWWTAGYGGGVFVPVRDALAGRSDATGTYGGGRYLLDTIKGADLGGDADHLVIDFNFAYNPSCAYDPNWSCPLPGPGNTVAVALPVGERAYRGPQGRLHG